jgi:hypothetical protein
MPELSLLDAFRACGPLLGVPQVDGVRDAAAARLLRELRRLAAGLRGFTPAIRDDATQVVVMRLVRVGPRGLRQGDPQSDDGVRGYLLTALRNAARDLLPHPALGQLSPGVERRAATSNPGPAEHLDEEIEKAGLQGLLEDARRRLGEVITLAAEALEGPARERFLSAIAELTDVAEGRRAFDGIVDDEIVRTGAAPRAAKNRLYKRYSRALERVVEAIERLARTGAIGYPEQQALLAAMDWLRLRPGGGQ